MNAIKGITKIELTDVNTGEVETAIEENMFTNYYRDLMTPKLLCDPRVTTSATTVTYMIEELFGGIMCFPDVLEENADSYELPDVFTASASNYAFSDYPKSQGSFNGTTSSVSEDGHSITFEWDWTPEQGNGTIAAVGLMPALGADLTNGINELTSTARTSIAPKNHSNYALANMIYATFASTADRSNGGIVYVSFKDEYCVIAPVYLANLSTNTFKVYKFRVPCNTRYPIFDLTTQIQTIGSNANGTNLNVDINRPLAETTIMLSTSAGVVNRNIGHAVSKDGHVYYIPGATIKANAEFTVFKLACDTLEFSEFTLINSTGVDITISGGSQGFAFGIMGNYFIFKGAVGGLYAINYINYTDSHEIKDVNGESILASAVYAQGFGPEHNGKCMVSSYSYLVPPTSTATHAFIGSDFVLRYCRGYNSDWWYRYSTDSNWGANICCTDSNLICGQTFYRNESARVKFWQYQDCLLTINNLSSPVVKTADKSMKITYTLTEIF